MSALQSERRQAFSRCSGLWQNPIDVINLITQDHAFLAGDPHWVHMLSANLNNEIDASGWLPVPWDGVLDPLTGVLAIPGWREDVVNLTWDASPNEADDTISITIRKLQTPPDHFHGSWTINATNFRPRVDHIVNIYSLDVGVLYQFSLTPYGSAPFSFAKSVNDTSYTTA